MPGSRARGVAAVEFTLIALPLLLAGLAVLEVSRWHTARLVVGQATLAAARAGQDGWQSPERVRERFEAGLLPLWGGGADSVEQAAALARLHARARQLFERSGVPLWQLNPSSQRVAPHSAESLVLEVQYLQRPLVPGMSALLQHLGAAPPDSPARRAMRHTGWLPIRQRLAIEWHAPPRAQNMAGLLAHPAAPGLDSPAPPGALTPDTKGLWFLPDCPGTNCGAPSHPGPPPAAPPDTPGKPDLCGVLLCCP